jgi:hypothetical protein
MDDTALNRKARKTLGYSLTGELSEYEAQQVKREVGVLRAIHETRRLAPNAVIKRKGFELSIQVQV